ncbi:MAG: divergent polysaccharide deacetylase family protein [Pseudomonadota bacterium]
MARREIRRMLTTPRKRLRDHPWALPGLMAGVLLLGLGFGLAVGLLAGRDEPGPSLEELVDRPPRRDEAPAPVAEEAFRPLVPVPQARPGGPSDDGVYRGDEEAAATVQQAAVPLLLPQHSVEPVPPGGPAWKRHAVAAPRTAGLPMIAVVIDDMGIDRRRSERTAALRAPLTLAWLPYAEDLPRQTEAARKRGHELLVHMPMEPLGESYDPGPDVLEVGLGPDEIRRRVALGLSRFEGFVGVNNHMGSRFTGDAAGMRVVMEEMRRRGLLFLDSVTTEKSVAPDLARRYMVPFAARQVFLDNDQSVAAVRAQLAKLEAHARKHGAAIAIGHPHDATIEALAGWLPTLEARGFVLVPLTAVVKARWAQG